MDKFHPLTMTHYYASSDGGQIQNANFGNFAQRPTGTFVVAQVCGEALNFTSFFFTMTTVPSTKKNEYEMWSLLCPQGIIPCMDG